MGQPASGASALVGRVVASLRLEQIIGSGATSVVYLGRQEAENAPAMAVKVLMLPMHLVTSDRDKIKERFQREAGLLQRLHHPNILPVHAFGEDPNTGLIYMVLPYISGGTLAGRLALGQLPLHEAAHIADRVASALDYAHQHGIVHRDVKPANILLDEQQHAYLSDFGIARIFDQVHTMMTATGTVIGSAEYMSPEQARGDHVGPASDIYSLGAVLYQMVTGHIPFSAPSFVQLVLLHLQAPPPPPRMLRPDLPEFAAISIVRALAKDPAQRFPTAGALAHAFAAGLQGQPGAQMASISPGEGTTRVSGWSLPTVAVSASNDAPTIQSGGVAPTFAVTPLPGLTAGKRRPKRGAAIVTLSLLLLVALATIALSQTGLLAVLSPQPDGQATPPVTTAASPTDPSVTSPVAFQFDQVYTYNVLIGHTKPNQYTNDDVYVTLVSVRFDAASGTSQLTVMFQNDDSAKSADLAIANTESGLPPQNVYMIDNNGIRYPALVATPNEVVVGPGQTMSLVVSLALIQPTASSLAIYFNTKSQALDTQCTQVYPTGQAAICPGT